MISPDLISDIMNTGIILAGGGALIEGIEEVITRECGVKAIVSDDPMRVVTKGLIEIIEYQEFRHLMKKI